MTVHREDYREVRPTADEVARYVQRHPWAAQPGARPAVPMAEHLPCGTRHWYSGLGIGAHMRSCPGRRSAVAS